MTQSEYQNKLIPCDREFERIMKLMSADPDRQTLKRAYRTLKLYFGEQTRKSGELSILHCLLVARLLAEMGFESSVVAAGLLHDIIEDTSYGLAPDDEQARCPARTARQIEQLKREYGEVIAEMVNAVTAIDAIGDDKSLPHKDVETYRKLYMADPAYRFAFYVKFADRLHNLSDAGAMSPEKMLRKASDTERFLLPLAKALGAIDVFEKLSDLCLRIAKPELYKRLSVTYDSACSVNAEAIATFERLIRGAFANTSAQSDPVESIIVSRLSPFQLYSFTGGETSTGCGIKRRAPMLDAFVLLKEGLEASVHAIMMRALTRMAPASCALVRIIRPSEDEPVCYIVSDRTGCLFRIRLMRAPDYARYLYGDIERADIPEYTANPYAAVQPLITVYKLNNAPLRIPDGSTLLDFAFLLHENIGLYTKSGTINGAKCSQLDMLLKDEDRVVVNSDYTKGSDITERVKPYAKLDWLLKTNTYEAHRKLVRYFKSLYERK